ncbi:MAG: hypothetical protein ACP5OA_01180 [Candidatus Woesearchaeota archaeon]
MEFQTLKFQAVEKLKIADHLIDTTYSLVKEPKLLVSVIENISQALELTITALLEYEKSLKNIIKYDDAFQSKIEIFRRKIMTKYNISSDVLDFILDVRKTLDNHKKSTVEFTKKEKFVISDNDYNVTTLNIDDVKKTLSKAKHHVKELLKIMKYES